MLASRRLWAAVVSVLLVAPLGGCVTPYEPRIEAGNPFVEVRSSSDARMYVPQCRGTAAEIGIYGAIDGEGHIFAKSVEPSSKSADKYVEVWLDVDLLMKGDAGPGLETEDFEPFPSSTQTLDDFGTMYYPSWNGRTLRVADISALEPGQYRYEQGQWRSVSSDALADALDLPVSECG